MELCNQLAHLQLGIIGGGVGVTIAMLDTGYFSHPALDKNIYGNNRVLAQYDAISDQVVAATANTDENGHGAHVASLAVGDTARTH